MRIFCRGQGRNERESKTLWMVFLVFTIGIFGVSRTCFADESLPLRISGSAEFKLKYARGDGAALAGTGYSLGRPDISQLLSLRVQGQLAPGLSISANLDNRKGGNLQMLDLRLDGEHIQGRFGGLSFKSQNPYTAYTGRLRGVEVAASFPQMELGFSAGRVQGIAAKKTFRGSSAEETIIYKTRAPYGPSPTETGFEASLEGMQYFTLTEAFDPHFMGVWFRFVDDEGEQGRTLAETLQLWDLDYLYLPAPSQDGGISAGTKIQLEEGQFAPISSAQELLALRMEITNILRTQIQDLIRAYNRKHGLTGAAQKKYPFIYESEAERAFLSDLLTRHTHIAAGMENETDIFILDVRADSYRQRALYDLGNTNIEPGSIQIEVRKGAKFLPIETELPLLFQIEYGLGIMEFDFPADFFKTYDAIRVQYAYEIAEGIFNLGLSIVEGSEKVYLNDVLLAKGGDYLLDYELGILTILKMLSAEDVVRVEYEYFRGPFGRVADYKSNFYAAYAGWAPTENLQLQLELAAYVDQMRSAQRPDLTPTMPNNHLIAGLTGQYENEKLSVSGDLAFSHNSFPFDDNQKTKAPNKITAITEAVDAEGQTYLLFAHHDGISAGAGDFQNYSVGAGLSSARIRGLATADETWFFATDEGLTVLTALPGPGGQNPFDYIGNWQRIYTSDGLPGNDITAVVTTPWKIWLGTSDGYLSSADLDALDIWMPAGFSGGAVAALAYDPIADQILAAAEKGLYSSRGNQFNLELAGEQIDAIWSSFATINGMHSFAAGKGGIYGRDSGGNWAAIDIPPELKTIQCLTVWQDKLWAGAADGLYFWDGESWCVVEPTLGHSITALGPGPGYRYTHQNTLWVGTAGKALEEEAGQNTIVSFEVLEPRAIAEHGGSELAIAADNPRRYVDLRHQDHTATGYAARIHGRYGLENGSIYGSYETSAPGFTKIGQSSRQAADVLRLGTQWTVSPQVGITAEHTRTMAKLASAPQQSQKTTQGDTTRIAGTFDLGPQVDVALNLARTENKQIPGAEQRERGFSITGRDIFFDNRLSVGASYEVNKSDTPAKPENSFRQTILRADARLTLDSLSLSGNYRRPTKTIDPGGETERISGIEEMRFNAQWNKQLNAMGLSARYNHTSRNNIATMKTFANKRAELRLTLPNIPIRDEHLTPSAVLQWDKAIPFSGQPRQSIMAQGNVTANFVNVRTTSGLVLKRVNYTGVDKLVFDTEIFTSLNFTSEKRLRPQFDVRWKRSKSVRPDLGEAITDSFSGTARLIWVPVQGIHNTTSAAYSLSHSALAAGTQTHSLSLQNTFSYIYSKKITLTGTANIRLSDATKKADAGHALPEIRYSITGNLNYRFNEIWSLGTTLGFNRHNSQRVERPANAFTMEAGLKATF